MEAVWAGDAQVLDERMKEGEEVDWGARCEGMSPLYHAVARGRATVVKLLLRAGADVNLAESHMPGLPTPLHNAASYGRIDVAELLLQAGADVNAYNDEASC